MRKLAVFFLTAGFVSLLSCEKEKSPFVVQSIAFKMQVQGQVYEVEFTGKEGEDFDGWCYLTGEGAQKELSFRVARHTPDGAAEVEMRDVGITDVQQDNLSCGSVHFLYKGYEEKNSVSCGSQQDGKCFLTGRYDPDRKVVEGTFDCGEYDSTLIDVNSNPVPMKVYDGVFILENCKFK